MPTCGQRSRRGVELNPQKWYLSAYRSANPVALTPGMATV